MARTNFERLNAVLGLKNGIAAHSKKLASELANICFVLDDKNGFTTAENGRRLGLSFGLFGGLFCLRQVNLKRGAFSRSAVHIDEAAALLHDAIDRGKPKSGPLADFLGGEKRFEDVGF